MTPGGLAGAGHIQAGHTGLHLSLLASAPAGITKLQRPEQSSIEDVWLAMSDLPQSVRRASEYQILQ